MVEAAALSFPPPVEEDRRVAGVSVRRSLPPAMLASRSPVLMIHGAYHDWWAFDRWRRLFAEAGWVADAVSLREGSAVAGPEPELFDFADRAVAVARAYERPPIVIGHSMGGLLAQKIAESMPCRAVVLLASVGPGQLGAHDPTNLVYDFGAEYEAELDPAYVDPETHRWVAGRLVVESPTALASLRNGRMAIDAARVQCPMLVIGARQDQTRVHAADRIGAVYGADVLWFDHARHDLQLESKWFEVGQATIEWLIARVGETQWAAKP